ncbi:MAG: hypothetical protein ACP5D2_02965 [Candidatus Nanoarchaeia archaeon]
MVEEYTTNPFRRTIAPEGRAPNVNVLDGVVSLERRYNIDNHYILDDLQYCVNVLYRGDEEYERTKTAFLNSLNRDFERHAAERAFDDAEKRYKNEESIEGKLEQGEQDSSMFVG